MYVTFDNPFYLWLLFSIPLFIISHFFFLRRSKSKAMKFANVETIRRISGEKLITKNITHLILRVTIIFCLIIAMAGTKLWYMGASDSNNYVFALDASASMTSEDVKPTRFTASKDDIREMIKNLDARTSIGLVTFAGTTIVEQPLTDSKIDFLLSLDRVSVSTTGGTDLPGAIITSTNLLLTHPDEGKSLIIVSDGVNTLGAYVSDPVVEAVAYAKQNQVIIYTVGVGTNTGPIGYLPEYYNISSSYNEDTMRYVANMTGGKYFHATTADELVQSLDYLSKNTTQQYIDINISFITLLLSVVFLFVEWGLANTLYRRVL
jgi:Ca-activated chloride channel family protein